MKPLTLAIYAIKLAMHIYLFNQVRDIDPYVLYLRGGQRRTGLKTGARRVPMRFGFDHHFVCAGLQRTRPEI